MLERTWLIQALPRGRGKNNMETRVTTLCYRLPSGRWPRNREVNANEKSERVVLLPFSQLPAPCSCTASDKGQGRSVCTISVLNDLNLFHYPFSLCSPPSMLLTLSVTSWRERARESRGLAASGRSVNPAHPASTAIIQWALLKGNNSASQYPVACRTFFLSKSVSWVQYEHGYFHKSTLITSFRSPSTSSLYKREARYTRVWNVYGTPSLSRLQPMKKMETETQTSFFNVQNEEKYLVI